QGSSNDQPSIGATRQFGYWSLMLPWSLGFGFWCFRVWLANVFVDIYQPATFNPTMRLLLIDGHYYVYRSFFAIPNLSNSRGEPTNAIFGFTKTLRLMLKHLQPELGAVVWDEGLPQKRVELQPAYKETRKEMPKPMIPQLEFIQKLTPLLGFRNISLPDTEADDLMGCYAIAACKRPQMEVVLATNDKDLYQLVGPGVKVYTTAKADLAS